MKKIILNSLINKLKTKDGKSPESLDKVFKLTFGSFIGTAINIIYIAWLVILAATQLRAFAEKFISTMLIYTPKQFFLITMILVVFFTCKGKIATFGRFAEFTAGVFVCVFAFIIIAAMKDISMSNLWPVTIYDTKNILLSLRDVFSPLSIITYSLFLGEYIINKDELKKEGMQASVLVTFISLIIVVLIIGIFSATVAKVFPQPFFMALKVISVFGVIERIESVFITIWIAVDFTIISYYILACTNICKNTFKLSERKIAVAPVVLLVYFLSMFLARDYFSFDMLYRNYILIINIIFGAGIPLAAYIVARLRRQIYYDKTM